jgi:hypothetical protein
MGASDPLDDLSLQGIRANMRQMNARIGNLEGRMGGVEERSVVIADDVAETKVSVTRVEGKVENLDSKMDSIITHQKEERDLRIHRQKIELEREANKEKNEGEKQTALISLKETKISSRTKTLVGLFGIISAVIGAIIQSII